MFGFGKKEPLDPYRMVINPYTYYGSSRKRALSLLKKFFKGHKGFDAIENMVSNKAVKTGGSLCLTFSCDSKTRHNLDELLKKNGHSSIDRSHMNKEYLVRRGFIKSAEDKDAPFTKWITADW